MSSGKATLGFPSRTLAIQAMRLEGLTTNEIARRIGIRPNSVTALEVSARRAGVPRNAPLRVQEPIPAGQFPVDVLNKLRKHAARRGLGASTLARMIVEKVVEDRLVDAVLDDADEALS